MSLAWREGINSHLPAVSLVFSTPKAESDPDQPICRGALLWRTFLSSPVPYDAVRIF
jgi:hypothetical protein